MKQTLRCLCLQSRTRYHRAIGLPVFWGSYMADALIVLITPLSQRSMWVAFEYGHFWGQNGTKNLYVLHHPKATIPGPLSTLQSKSVINLEELDVFFRELCSHLHLKCIGRADLQAIISKANSIAFETAAERAEKELLISRMGGTDNALALDAVRMLRLREWLLDGSLERQVFTGANLQQAPLEKAKLRDAKINHANLKEANLKFADLRGADLGGSDFQRITPLAPRAATLAHANAENAIFGSAILYSVNLSGTNLKGADLREAKMKGAIMNENTQFDERTILPDGSIWTSDTNMERWTKRKFLY